MEVIRVYWLNVDKPTNVSRLHKSECSYCKPNGTYLKGKEVEKVDGGWFSFASVSGAKQFQETRFPKQVLLPCAICNPF